MKSDNLDSLIKTFKDKVGYNYHKAVHLWDELDVKLSPDKLLYIIERLAQDNIFAWFYFICAKLPETVQSEKFHVLIVQLFEKLNKDLMQLMFNKTLVDIGKVYPEESLKHVEKLLENYDNASLFVASLLLGGILRKNDVSVFNKVKELLNSENRSFQESGIRAIRFSLSELDLNKFSEIIRILDDLFEKSEDISIKTEIALSYLSLYSQRPKGSISRIEELICSGEKDIGRILLKAMLGVNGIPSHQKLKWLLRALKSGVTLTTHEVSLMLYHWGPSNLEIMMEIVKFIISQRDPLEVVWEIDWALSKVCSGNVSDCLRLFEKKLLNAPFTNANPYVLHHFCFPKLLLSISSDDKMLLLNRLKEWISDQSLEPLVIKTVRLFLAENRDKLGCYDSPTSEGEALLDSCIEIIKKMAIKKNLNPEHFMKKEERKIFQCAALLEAIDGVPQVDLHKVLNNLNKFPKLKSLSEEWIKENFRNIKTHPLILLLSNSLTNLEEYKARIEEIRKEKDNKMKEFKQLKLKDMYRNYALLTHIENCLHLIRQEDNFHSQLKKKLCNEKNEHEFWAVLSELDAICRLRRKFNVTINPSVEVIENGKILKKHPDLSISIDGKEILIEVITPQMMPELRYLGSASIPNRLADKVYDEFKKHFKGMVVKHDCLVIVNKEHSEIDYESAKAYTEGSLQFTIVFNKETGEVIDEFLTRAEDYMTARSPEMNVIIGIIIYSRVVGSDGKIHLKGRFFASKGIEEEKVKLGWKIAKSFLG